MTTIDSQCFKCKHYTDNNMLTPTCDAYRIGIPDELLLNTVYHTKPYPGDNGIQFEAKDE